MLGIALDKEKLPREEARSLFTLILQTSVRALLLFGER